MQGEVSHLKIWLKAFVPFVILITVAIKVFFVNEGLGKFLMLIAFSPLLYGIVCESREVKSAGVDLDKGSKTGNFLAWVLGFTFIGGVVWLIVIIVMRELSS